MFDQIAEFLFGLRPIELGLFLLVLFALLFWVYLYLKEYSRITWGGIISIFRKKKKKKDVKLVLLNDFIDKTSSVKEKMEKPNKMVKSLSLFVKEFFGKWYDIDYKFTIQELIEEIKETNPKLQKDIVLFLIKLGDKGFDPDIEKEDVIDLVEKSQKLAKDMYKTEVGKAHKKRTAKGIGWFSKFEIIPDIDWSLGGRRKKLVKFAKSARLVIVIFLIAMFSGLVIFYLPEGFGLLPSDVWSYIALIVPLLLLLVVVLVISFFYYHYKQLVKKEEDYIDQLKQTRNLLKQAQKEKERKEKLKKLEKQRKLLDLSYKNNYIKKRTYKKYMKKISKAEEGLSGD